MIVVVTGMVGVNKKSYLNDVCDLARKNGKEIELCNIGDMMYKEAADIPAGKILDISMRQLHSLRRSIFKDVIAKSKKTENLIVNTHATFRWKHGLFPAVDFDQMRLLNADIYINLIDGVPALHYRLENEHHTQHDLKDLIVWREEEILGTEMICKGINDKIPFYCLARGNQESTVKTLYKLIFAENTKKAYLSFPMTHVEDIPAVKNDILKFRDQMHDLFICFDPADLEEAYLPIAAKKAKADGHNCLNIKISDHNVSLDINQVLQIERDINSQIYARDFLLIDQSDMIISFIPALPDGRAAISSGVERELQHAHEAAKQVYVIWTAEQNPSVFVTQTANKVFRSVEQAMTYFSKKGYSTK
ncbi:MAG: AAA family ATPase [Phycisphaerae bacterium]|nr:AAA family ATPase [Phycisphaerae bacterium]